MPTFLRLTGEGCRYSLTWQDFIDVDLVGNVMSAEGNLRNVNVLHCTNKIIAERQVGLHSLTNPYHRQSNRLGRGNSSI